MIPWFELSVLACLVLLGGHVWLYYRVLRPLRRLASQAADLTQGNLDALEQPCGGIGEIDALRCCMAGMVGHVRRAQEQSRAYTNVLARTQEAERARMARELHDDTIQALVAVAHSIEMSRNWIETEPEKAGKALQSARQQVVGAIHGLRTLIADLRPPALEELGLIAALQMQAEKLADLTIKIMVNGTARRLDEARELTLFRCAQEALTNARIHGKATEAAVAVNYARHEVSLAVKDNGTGFTAPSNLDDLATSEHYGLVGIQERVQSLGGHVHIASSPGEGTTITLHIPEERAPQPTHAVRDPVCSALIEPQQAYGSVEHNDQRYYFCCPVCQGAFQKNPAMYLPAEPKAGPDTPVLQ